MSDDIQVLSTEQDSSDVIIDIDEANNNSFFNSKKKIESTSHPKIKSFLSKIDSFDRNISSYIYELELNKIFENIIYIFGRIFNPDMMIIFYSFVFLYQSFRYNNYYYLLKPAIHVFTVFFLSGFLKYIIKRPRPEINKKSKRLYNLRKKEKNFSMPSGDSIQAANFAIMALFYFNISFFGFILIPFVMFSRIFYFCHYLFDTIIGAFIGLSVSFGLIYLLRLLNI